MDQYSWLYIVLITSLFLQTKESNAVSSTTTTSEKNEDKIDIQSNFGQAKEESLSLLHPGNHRVYWIVRYE